MEGLAHEGSKLAYANNCNYNYCINRSRWNSNFLLFILLVEVQIPYLVLGGTMISNSLIVLVLYKLKLNISELFKSETTKVLHLGNCDRKRTHSA